MRHTKNFNPDVGGQMTITEYRETHDFYELLRDIPLVYRSPFFQIRQSEFLC